MHNPGARTLALMGGRRDGDVPQSRGMEADEAALRAYYERGMERERLSDGRGDLEFTRTTEIVARGLPAAPAVVADIGGGPGTVRAVAGIARVPGRAPGPDPAARRAARGGGGRGDGIRTAVGDVRDIDLPGASVDAVLLLGPLYHLIDRAERVRALRECARIVRPGGPVFAAVISRWAARIDGMLRERLYLKYPAALDLIDEIDGPRGEADQEAACRVAEDDPTHACTPRAATALEPP